MAPTKQGGRSSRKSRSGEQTRTRSKQKSRRVCGAGEGEEEEGAPAHSMVTRSRHRKLWSVLPQSLVRDRVLGNLYVQDMLRMANVCRSWNTAILARGTPSVFQKQRAWREDIPWFYCETRVMDENGMPKQCWVAFDPNKDQWRWSPPLPQALREQVALASKDTRKCFMHSIDFVKPVCSVDGLVCWNFRCRCTSFITKAFAYKFWHVLPLPKRPHYILEGEVMVHLEQNDEGLPQIKVVDIQRPPSLNIEIHKYDPCTNTMQVETTLRHMGQVLAEDFRNVYLYKNNFAIIRETFVVPRTTPQTIEHHDGLGWHSIPMPNCSESQVLRLNALYEIVQMEAHLLLVVLKRNPTKTKRQVYLYEYMFEQQDWNLIDKSLTIPFNKYTLSFATSGMECVVASNGHLLLLGIPDLYLYTFSTSTWRTLPPCMYDNSTKRASIHGLGCSFEPTLRGNLLIQ